MEIIRTVYQGLSYNTYLAQLSPNEFDLNDQELINIADRGNFNFGGKVERMGLSGRAKITVYRD